MSPVVCEYTIERLPGVLKGEVPVSVTGLSVS